MGDQAIAYLRVSTEEQAAEGVSLDAQEDRIRAYAALRGLELVELVCDPGVSAGKTLAAREGGGRLLEVVRRGRARAVIAYKLDRLFRDAADCLTVTAGWDKAGVALHLVDLGGQSIDTGSALGRFFLTVIAGAAEMERNLVRERTALAMARKRERREFCGGEPPYGWRLGADGVHLEPEPVEQAVAVAARRLRGRGLSLRQVAARLEGRGLRPRSGGRWYATTVQRLLVAEVGP